MRWLCAAVLAAWTPRAWAGPSVDLARVPDVPAAAVPAPLPVVRWSREGNPILLLRPSGDGVVFKPTQERLYAHRKYAWYAEGGRMTRLTRRKPLVAFYDASASPPVIAIRGGHHRFSVASRSGQPVYVELTSVRRPFDWEKREGRWESPIF